MNQPTLKQLRYFDALARHRHFGRAAKACSISQPALSMQIKELEEILGSKLFERTGREIQLSSFGEGFADRAVNILTSMDELVGFAHANQKEWMGRLRIGVIPTIAPYLLPSIIRQLNKHNPNLEIRARETLTQKLLDELHEGLLDTAIVALPVSEPTLEEVPLFSEEFVLVRQQSEKEDPPPNANQLSAMRLLLLEEGHCFRDQALSFCKIGSGTPREVLDGSSLSTLVQMVGAGIGVTLIPQMAVGVETLSAPVSISRFKTPAPSRNIGMVWRRSNARRDQLEGISKIILDAANIFLENNAGPNRY